MQILELLYRMFEIFRANIVTKETHKKILFGKKKFKATFKNEK